MTNRPTTDLPDTEGPGYSGRDDGAPKSRDPLHLTEGADPHGEVPVGPQSDIPLLRGPQDADPAGADRVSTLPLRTGLARSTLGIEQLWCRYIGVGGSMSIVQMAAALQGADLPRWEHDHLAQALNESFLERGGDHPVAYSDEVDG